MKCYTIKSKFGSHITHFYFYFMKNFFIKTWNFIWSIISNPVIESLMTIIVWLYACTWFAELLTAKSTFLNLLGIALLILSSFVMVIRVAKLSTKIHDKYFE